VEMSPYDLSTGASPLETNKMKVRASVKKLRTLQSHPAERRRCVICSTPATSSDKANRNDLWRILGIGVPGEKRIDIALRYIYGLGR
jgi:hypothetical protein